MEKQQQQSNNTSSTTIKSNTGLNKVQELMRSDASGKLNPKLLNYIM